MPCCHYLSFHLPKKQLSNGKARDKLKVLKTNEINCSRVETATELLVKRDEISSNDGRMLYTKCNKCIV